MIRGYLRYRRTMLSAALAASGVFSAVMLLAGLGGAMTLYANALYFFVITAFAVYDFFKYRVKMSRLEGILQNLSNASHDFPGWENSVEAAYSDIIEELYKLMDEEKSEMNALYGEQLDYYTMWLHQIKTPIAAMRLAIESESAANPVYEQELFKIERYVEMALQFLKIKNLESDLLLTPCDIDSVITESIKKYKTQFIYKKLGCEFESTKLNKISDRKWLAFIVEQLLSNAIKYTASGGVKIYPAEEGFALEDSGIGIRPEDLSRIFERGYTGFNGRLDSRASGLGLYMASQIAKKLGIEIRAESRVGEGTRMSLIFKELETGANQS
ncbi:MAG: sensor histidine kinase [Oscillospiraceae bacterium]|nr:sensor histidine kinase [Oscillospiraceae bacterium]